MTKSLSNKLFLKKQLYSLRMKKGTPVLQHLNAFNQILSDLLALKVKLEEKEKALLLLSSLPPSYNHLPVLERESLLIGKLTRIVEGRRVIAKEVDDKRTKEEAAENSSSSRKQVGRSTGPVDRLQYQKFGRPSRLTVNTQLSVGHPVDRPVDQWKGSVDRQSGAGNFY